MNDKNSDSLRSRLLARHAAAIPALDSARRRALAETLRDTTPVPISQLLPALFGPQRHLWTAFAATWVLLAALHLSQRTSSEKSFNASPLVAASPDASRSESASHPTRVVTVYSFADRQAQLHALLR